MGYRFANSPNKSFEKNIQDETIFQQINQDVEKLPLIKTDEESFKEKEWVKFINSIQHHKLLNTNYDNRITSKQKKRMKRRVTFYDPEKDKFITRSPSNRVQYATESHDLGGDGWYMYKLLNKETKVKAKVNAKTSKTKKTKTKKAKSSKSTKKNQRKSKKLKKSRNQKKK